MAENKIELKSVSELLGMNFFIPSYQRGYRWTTQQVKDLLDDIQEFIDKKQEGFYCVQPLVVKVREQETLQLIQDKEKTTSLEEVKNLLKGSWEVIDGQQRLTTIFILLKYIEPEKKTFELEYETRNTEESNSKEFLLSINQKTEKDADTNIDYFHIYATYQTIKKWFAGKDDNCEANFLSNLLQNVKFIWYESTEKDSIKVFTRLNIGKISLTNAELIKALFLNKSNFQCDDYQKIRLQQQEIAMEWDTIEYTLQNDEFWLFLNEKNYDKPTRIDMLFDLMLEADETQGLNTDEYKTFRYFYGWFKKNDKPDDIKACWSKVKTLFQTFQEWFNDLKLYHYVGFLVEHKTKIKDLVDEWNKRKTKHEFISEYLIKQIRSELSKCKDLNKQYEVSGIPKTQCRPILLLHNIQTVINQNNILEDSEKYQLPVFYKFPFHLFKKEKWDVEHIDSHTENPLENEKDQKEWLKYSYDFVNKELQDRIKHFFAETEKRESFDTLYSAIIDDTSTKENDKLLDNGTVNEKDMLWNFVLLDSPTNRSYGNSIFPAKRRVIIGKDQGKKITVNDEFEVKDGTDEKGKTIAFIPPCTKNAFLKSYNPTPNNLREWDKKDAKAYLENIKSTLANFLQ
jgi:uncharacterized protein with ParB-like and HNH nuclease domain